MDTLVVALIREAITAWAQQVYATEAVFVGQITHEEALEEDGAQRYLVDLAIRPVGSWLVLEVWAAPGRVLTINDLGEGLPLDEAAWPWPADPGR